MIDENNPDVQGLQAMGYKLAVHRYFGDRGVLAAVTVTHRDTKVMVTGRSRFGDENDALAEVLSSMELAGLLSQSGDRAGG